MAVLKVYRHFKLIENTRMFSVNSKKIPDEFIALSEKRSRKERKDSVTYDMQLERYNHSVRCENIKCPVGFVRALHKLGLGQKKKRNKIYSKLGPDHEMLNMRTITGAGGYAEHVGSANKNWPLFNHLLPEIAFAGHSNSGKSTLINAMIGVRPSSGPAKVSDRAGWTDQICFYQLGKKPPVMTLVDFPGYGHAVTSESIKSTWKIMIRDYVCNRIILTRCYVLVDSIRGICNDDILFIKYLIQNKVDWKIIVTKCDLLSPIQLAQSMTAIYEDVQKYCFGKGDNIVLPNTKVSAIKNSESLTHDDGIGSDGNIDAYDDTELESSSESRDIDSDSESHNNDLDNEEEWSNISAAMRDMMIPVSASTGAGVHFLYNDLKKCVVECINASNYEHPLFAHAIFAMNSLMKKMSKSEGKNIKQNSEQSKKDHVKDISAILTSRKASNASDIESQDENNNIEESTFKLLPHVVREHPLAQLQRQNYMLLYTNRETKLITSKDNINKANHRVRKFISKIK